MIRPLSICIKILITLSILSVFKLSYAQYDFTFVNFDSGNRDSLCGLDIRTIVHDYEPECGSNGLVKYYYDWGDGLMDTIYFDPCVDDGEELLRGSKIHHYFTYGTYLIELKIVDDLDSGIYSKAFTFVDFNADVSFDVPDTLCVGSQIVFINTTTNPDDYNFFNWKIYDGESPSKYINSNTKEGPTVTYYVPGSFPLQLYGAIYNGEFFCASTYFDTLHVYQDTSLIESILLEQCPCDTLELSASGTANKWKWNFGNGDSIVGQDIKYAYRIPRNYTISLLGEKNNCIEIQQIQVNACVDSNYYSHSNDNWVFGDSAYVSFTSGVPKSLIGAKIAQWEGCATMSDPYTGRLLFYTDGIRIWDSTHNTMPFNLSYLLKGHNSSTQSVLIVPNPGNENQYYVFTANGGSTGGNKLGYYYSIVDMKENNGKGDVISGNNRLYNRVCIPGGSLPGYNTPFEQLTATIKQYATCNQSAEYWIVHEGCNDSIMAYLLTKDGISPPVQNYIPKKSNTPSYDYGGAAFSPSGTKLAINRSGILTQVFDFNLESGVLYNPIDIRTGGYSFAFSPSEKYLYVSTLSVIEQYEIVSGHKAYLKYSSTLLPLGKGPSTLFYGPDNRLYMGRSYNSKVIAAINNPNLPGKLCGITDSAVVLQQGVSRFGLQNIQALYIKDNHIDTFNQDLSWEIKVDSCNNTMGIIAGIDWSCDFLGLDVTSKFILDEKDSFINTAGNDISAYFNFDSTLETHQLKIILEKECFRSYKNTLLFNIKCVLEDDSSDIVENTVVNDTLFDDLFTDNDITFFIPNIFTPNGDNQNDLFEISGTFDEFKLRIYDKKGMLLFQSTKEPFWNGNHNGNIVPSGVYIYHFEGSNSKSSKLIYKTGNILVSY